MSDEQIDSVFEDLAALEPSSAVQVVTRWLEQYKLEQIANALSEAVLNDEKLLGSYAPHSKVASAVSSTMPPKQPTASAKAPTAEALPVPGTSSRPAKLYDADSVDPSKLPEALLVKPDPVFHGERDEKQREAAPLTSVSARPGAAKKKVSTFSEKEVKWLRHLFLPSGVGIVIRTPEIGRASCRERV